MAHESPLTSAHAVPTRRRAAIARTGGPPELLSFGGFALSGGDPPGGPDAGPTADERLRGLLEEYGRLLRAAIVRSCPRDMGLPLDDVEQDARLRLWQALRGEGPIADPASSLYGVAAAATIDAIRRVKARREAALVAEAGGEQAAPAPEGPRSPRAVADTACRRLLLERVDVVLARLEPKRRRVVGLHLQGLTTEEIAGLLGWSEAKARRRVSRGLGELWERLKGERVTDEASDPAPRGPVQDARRPDRAACPSGGGLAAASEGRLSEAEAARAADHLAACAECAGEYRVLAPLRAWSRQAEAAPAGARRQLRRPWLAVAAAAVVAAAIAAVGVLVRERAPAGPARPSQISAALRSLVPEGVPLSRERCLLRWTDAGEGARYSATVAHRDRAPVHAAEGLRDPELLVPVEAIAAVPAGGEIVWSVQATLPDGRRLRSPVFVARIR